MNRRVGQWTLALLAAVAGALILQHAQPAIAQAPNAKLTKVRLGEPIRVLSFAPVYLAMEQGYFRREGIDIDLVSGGGGPQVNAAFLSGEVEFIQTASTEILKILGTGQRVVAVSAINGNLTLQTILGRSYAKAKGVDPKDPLDKKIKALVGANMGAVALGGAHELFLRFNMTLAGLDPKSVNVIRVGAGPAAVAAMESGQIDGFIVSPPAGRQVEARGSGYIWIDQAEVPEYNDMIWEALIGKKEYVDQNERIVKAMVRAVGEGINFTRNHPDEAARIVAKYFRGQKPQTIEAGLRDVIETFVKDGRMTQRGWDNAALPMRKLGQLANIDTREGGFWTNRYIQNIPDGK